MSYTRAGRHFNVTTTAQPYRDDYHPLELFPYFRRFKPGVVRDVVFTFIWNCGLGFLFWLIAIALGGAAANARPVVLGWNLLIANAIGYCIHGFFLLGHVSTLAERAHKAGSVAITLYYMLVSTAGVVVGFLVVAQGLQEGQFINWFRNPRWVGVMVFSSVLISVIVSAIFFARERQARAEAALLAERGRADRIEREATLATLRALQAQIEPHFLFNTLANVSSLIDADPALSKRMLERFIRFLRASLDATRADSTTLAAEGELISAYLDVLQVRMGPRLRHSIDIAPDLAAFTLPPMLLQPVVENAIRHGVEPRVEGGEVRLVAAREGERVRIEVRDTGVGFASSTRGGTGLTNLRDRLKLLYGDRASVAIADNPGGGTIVTLTLPS